MNASAPDDRTLTCAEIELLHAYEAASDEGKRRLVMFATLLARILRPGESDAIGDELAAVFIHAQAGRSLKAIKRTCWQIIARHRMAHGTDSAPATPNANA